jgi:hypothetical protein
MRIEQALLNIANIPGDENKSKLYHSCDGLLIPALLKLSTRSRVSQGATFLLCAIFSMQKKKDRKEIMGKGYIVMVKNILKVFVSDLKGLFDSSSSSSSSSPSSSSFSPSFTAFLYNYSSVDYLIEATSSLLLDVEESVVKLLKEEVLIICVDFLNETLNVQQCENVEFLNLIVTIQTNLLQVCAK